MHTCKYIQLLHYTYALLLIDKGTRAILEFYLILFSIHVTQSFLQHLYIIMILFRIISSASTIPIMFLSFQYPVSYTHLCVCVCVCVYLGSKQTLFTTCASQLAAVAVSSVLPLIL